MHINTVTKIGYMQLIEGDEHGSGIHNKLTQAGCQYIYQDRLADHKAKRTQLNIMLANLRPGQVIYLTSLDQLGYSIEQLVQLVVKLNKYQITLISIDDRLDTRSREKLDVFHALYKMDHSLKQTQKVRIGRRPIMTDDKITDAKMMLDLGKSREEVAKSMGVSMATIYRIFPATLDK